MEIITGQIAIMFMLIALGFQLYRVGFITDAGTKQMSDLVLYVANPILIARALMTDFDSELLRGGLWAALLAAVLLGVSIVLARLCCRDSDAAREAISRFAVTFSNAGFVGIPLALSTVGAQGVFYISVMNTVQTFLLWTYGVSLASGDPREASPRKVVTNPYIIAMVLGLFCFITSLRPPVLILQALDALGDLNTGLVMLVFGAYLGECGIRRAFSDVGVAKACLLRLVAMPLLAAALVRAVGPLAELPEAVCLTTVMFQAMPVAAVTSLFAHAYGRGEDFGTSAVALSTMLSLVTLPLMLSLC